MTSSPSCSSTSKLGGISAEAAKARSDEKDDDDGGGGGLRSCEWMAARASRSEGYMCGSKELSIACLTVGARAKAGDVNGEATASDRGVPVHHIASRQDEQTTNQQGKKESSMRRQHQQKTRKTQKKKETSQ